MAEIIGVKFKESGKLYYFQPNDQYLLTGTRVIVETSRGTECGEVVMERRTVPDEQITHELKKVIREATAEDLRRVEENHAKEKTAFEICEQKILDHKLDMKLVSVEYAFDGSKILFCFTADGRVDFRELVKDLAGVFHTRIELRQIGVRDEAKMLGGLGICGRPFCCSTFLGDFIPVSIKMAKEQGLSLNPVKISGACGRLMCCLKYEEEAYQDLIKHTPKVGMHVNTPDGKGTVCEVNLITGNLRINMDNMPEAAPRTFNKKQVSSLGDTNELSAAEAAMFSSYVKDEEEGLTADEKLELERMIVDDGIAPDERPAANGPRKAKQERPRGEQNRQNQSADQRYSDQQSGHNRKNNYQNSNRPDSGRERQPAQNARGVQNTQQNKAEKTAAERQQPNAGQNNNRRGSQQYKTQKGQRHRQNGKNNGGNNNNNSNNTAKGNNGKAQQTGRPAQQQSTNRNANNANHRQGQHNRPAHNSHASGGSQNHNRSHGQHGGAEGGSAKHTKSE